MTVLDPGERHLLADALRPPPGFRFDYAVSTTYTLDLLTLLTLPVAFTLYRWAETKGQAKLDPLALLEAVRRHSRRISVFCNAGRIAVPKHSQLLFGYLEGSVIEATAPNGGAFHPKVTVLRYTADLDATVSDEDPVSPDSVCYRMLCASRNLTFDRSWDTLLTLEGQLDLNRVKAFSRNRPLSRFVGALPAMATRSVPEEVQKNVSRISDELLRVRFEAPAGFDDIAFWPIGLDEQKVWPFDTRIDRMLVVSPFVDPRFIDRMDDETDELHLVSRTEALDGLPKESLKKCDDCFALNDSAQTLEPQTEPDDEVPVPPEAKEEQSESETIEIGASETPLSGLHAKLFVADFGWNTRVWTGSANATEAAFERNVEFLVEMTGQASRCGVRAMLKENEEDASRDRHIGFRDLLMLYRRVGDPPAEDPIKRQLEDLIEKARTALIRARLVAKVVPQSSGGHTSYDMAVEATDAPPALPPEVTLVARPISLRSEEAIGLKDLSLRPVATFAGLSFEALTGFLAIDATATRSGRSQTAGFVLNLPLSGAPGDRENRLLLALLNNRQRLLRYLLLLLAEADLDPCQVLGQCEGTGDRGNGETRDTSFGLPLLEPLMRALDRDPHRLVHIARLVDDLQATEDGRKIVPAEFMAIWEPIWRASKEQADAKS